MIEFKKYPKYSVNICSIYNNLCNEILKFNSYTGWIRNLEAQEIGATHKWAAPGEEEESWNSQVPNSNTNTNPVGWSLFENQLIL